jgi:hypothetical protein
VYPVYVRGVAYLAAHHGPEAATGFQKIPDPCAIMLSTHENNTPTGESSYSGWPVAKTSRKSFGELSEHGKDAAETVYLTASLI